MAVKYIYDCSKGGKNGDGKEGRELRWPGLLCGGDLLLYGESEEDLRPMVGRLEHVSEFKYLGCVSDESGTDGA